MITLCRNMKSTNTDLIECFQEFQQQNSLFWMKLSAIFRDFVNIPKIIMYSGPSQWNAWGRLVLCIGFFTIESKKQLFTKTLHIIHSSAQRNFIILKWIKAGLYGTLATCSLVFWKEVVWNTSRCIEISYQNWEDRAWTKLLQSVL